MNKTSAALLAAAISLGGVDVVSASSSAQAIIDWDNLSFQLIDLSGGINIPLLNWTSKSGSVTSTATKVDPYDFDTSSRTSYGFTKTIFANADTDFTQGNALRNNVILSADASSQAGLTDVSGYNYANSSASNSGSFELTGKGWLLISMNWSVAATGTYGDWDSGMVEYANASIAINGSYAGLFNSGSAASSYSTPVGYWNTATADSQSGTFSMAVFNPGAGIITGVISAASSATAYSRNARNNFDNLEVSPVPVPGAIWLFASGLIVFFGSTKRKY
jgi:hypothetical protein